MADLRSAARRPAFTQAARPALLVKEAHKVFNCIKPHHKYQQKSAFTSNLDKHFTHTQNNNSDVASDSARMRMLVILPCRCLEGGGGGVWEKKSSTVTFDARSRSACYSSSGPSSFPERESDGSGSGRNRLAVSLRWRICRPSTTPTSNARLPQCKPLNPPTASSAMQGKRSLHFRSRLQNKV